MAKPAPSRVAAALDYLERLKSQAAEFGGGVVGNLADRARSVGGLAYEALATDPAMGRMTTAEFSEAADRPTPRLDQAARDIGTIGRAIVTQPIQTGRAIVQGEVERAREAMSNPRAAGEYAGSFIDPMRIAAALRRTAPVLELDVYHGTPHRFPATEANPLGEFDASKIGTGEGAQAYGHGIYFAENPRVAGEYQKMEANIPQSPVRMFKGHELQAGSPQYHAATLVGSMGLNKARKEVANWIATADPRMTQEIEGWKQTLDTLNAAASKSDFKTAASKGTLYKADLPDETIDRMLDWDKPLSEQPESVIKALTSGRAKLSPEMLVEIERRYGATPSGNRFGQGLQDFLMSEYSSIKTPADVSDWLRKRGIPGVKYLDAGSRGQGGTGTRNFVVFPGEEKKVKILERK